MGLRVRDLPKDGELEQVLQGFRFGLLAEHGRNCRRLYRIAGFGGLGLSV